MRKRLFRTMTILLLLLGLMAGGTYALAAPASPSNLTAAIGGPRQVNLTWQDNSIDEKEFSVERANDSAFSVVQRRFKVNGTATTGTINFNDNSVTAGQTFFYRVLALDNAGAASAPSNTAQIDFSTPAGPANLVATVVSTTRVDLTWVDNAVNETSYDVDRALDAGFLQQRVSREFLPANSTSFVDDTVQPDTTYFFRVQAVNLVGDSPVSNVVSVTTSASSVSTPPPSAPSNLSANAVAANQVNLTWTDTSTTETGFRIERSSDNVTTFSSVGTAGANIASFTDSTVAASVTYSYRVIASSTAGDSTASNVVSVTTPAAVAPVPSGGGGGGGAAPPAPPATGGGGVATAGGGGGGEVSPPPVSSPTTEPSGDTTPPAGNAPTEMSPAPEVNAPAASESDSEPTLTITSPTDGATLSAGNINVTVQVSNFELLPIGQPGAGHIHYYLDVDIPTTPGAPAVTAAGTYKPTAQTIVTWENVAPGTHTFGAQLVDSNHMPLEPAVTAKVTVTVTAPPPTVPSTPTPTPGAATGMNWWWIVVAAVVVVVIVGGGILMRRRSA